MSLYARVLDGEIAEFRDHAATPPVLAASKGAWLPVIVEDDPDFDPVTEVLGDPAYEVGIQVVTQSRPVIAKDVPLEVPLWRVRVIMAQDGTLAPLDAAVANLDDTPENRGIQERWLGPAPPPNLLLSSTLVQTMIAAFSLDPAYVNSVALRAVALPE